MEQAISTKDTTQESLTKEQSMSGSAIAGDGAYALRPSTAGLVLHHRSKQKVPGG